MTEGNRGRNLRLELERAAGSLTSARLLLEAGQYADSVSRAYYAMLGGARALLLTEGLEARTHQGVQSLLNLHFVRQGLFPPAMARRLGRMQNDREAADYDRAAVFTAEMASEALLGAQEFLTTCREAIGGRGFSL